MGAPKASVSRRTATEGDHVAFAQRRQKRMAMRRGAKALEVARTRQDKARRFADAAPNMPSAEDRALLIQYAKFLDEEAAKLKAIAAANERD
jgi:hypothetical protein